MLKLNGQDFTIGSAKFLDEGEDFREATPKVFVRIEFPELESWSRTFAQLDTGAAWSLLKRDLAEALGVIDGMGELVRMRTATDRLGLPQEPFLLRRRELTSPDPVKTWLLDLQDRICAAIEEEDGSGRF